MRSVEDSARRAAAQLALVRSGARRIARLARSRSITGKTFLARYRALRVAYRCGQQDHHPRAIVELVTVLAEEPRIRPADIDSLLGGSAAARQRALGEVRRITGQHTAHRPRTAPREAVDELRAWVISQVGVCPDTAWGGDPALPWAAPSPGRCRRLRALRNPALRLIAALSQLIRAAGGLSRDSRSLRAWEELDRLALAATDAADGSPPPDWGAIQAQALAEQDDPTTLRPWQCLTTETGRVREYCRAHAIELPPLAAALLAMPSPPRPLLRSALRVSRAQQGRRRAETADPIADHWQEFRRKARTVVEQVAAIRDAFEACCERLARQPGPRTARCFSLTVAFADDGRRTARTCRLDFRVWPADELMHRLGEGSETRVDPQASKFYLEWVGPRAGGGGDVERVLPFLGCYRRGLFIDTAHRTLEQDRDVRTLCREARWSPLRWSARLFRHEACGDQMLAGRAWQSGMVLLPIAMLHYALVVGRAILENGLCHGGRMSEILQASAAETCFHMEPDGAVYYEAFAKGRSEPVHFYCDECVLAAIEAVLRVSRRNGWPLGRVEPLSAWRPRSTPALYIYQFHKRVIDPDVANACLRMLLWGQRLTAHDLRHCFAKIAASIAGQDRTQAALHHRRAGLTAYYARPTARAQKELAHRMMQLRGDQSDVGETA